MARFLDTGIYKRRHFIETARFAIPLEGQMTMSRYFLLPFCIVLIVLSSPNLEAQTMNASDATAAAGASVDIDFTMDSGAGDIQGWSLGVCHPADLTANSISDGAGAANSTSTVKSGSPADFIETSIYAEGWTQGVVICFTGCAVLASGSSDFLMATTTYDVDSAAAPGTYPLDYCSTLGSPPVSTVVVIGGASTTPTQNSGSVEVLDIPDPTFSYTASRETVNYSPDDGSASFSVDVSAAEVDNSALGTPFPNTTQGFSMGLAHDNTLLEPTSVTFVGPVAALDGGAGPGFAETSIYADGWTAGVVYSFIGAETITFNTGGDAIIEAQYSAVAGALTGDEDGATTNLNWSGGLGSPNVSNVMVVAGNSYPAQLNDATITLEAVSVTPFLRSDANADSRTDVADAVWMLSDLFLGGPHTDCNGANDANNDGVYDTADPVFVINYQFLDGTMPSAPFPDCGIAANQQPIDCLAYPSCN